VFGLILDPRNPCGRVVEAGEDPRFSPESIKSVSVVSEGVRKDLQRHVPVERGIAGLVDLAHAVFADLGGDGVAAEGGAW